MGKPYCDRCLTPTDEPDCVCGASMPPGGWPTDALVDHWIGDRLRLCRRLHAGGGALVYLAERFRPYGRAVVKVAYGVPGMRCWEARIDREAEALQLCRSEGVIRMLERGGLQGGRQFLALELLQGEPLTPWLTEAPPPLERSIRLVCHLADVLAGVHGCGVVHRDVKPSNIFVRSDGLLDDVTLIDFGVAQLPDSPGDDAGPDAIVGTPRYMAPEQLLSPRDADHRVDIFALGLILYELLSGAFPYPEEPPLATLARRVRARPLPLSPLQIAPAAPSPLVPLINRMIDPVPERRLPRMSAVVEELLGVLEDIRRERDCQWSTQAPFVLSGPLH